MGSKNRIAKYILPIILKDRKPEQWYAEPFVGGCNIIDKVDGNRIGNDSNYYLIKMWIALQNGWNPPDLITEELYNKIKSNPKKYDPHLVAYVAFMSFGAKWFGGYRRNKVGSKGDINNMKYQSRVHKEGILKQVEKLRNVVFKNQLYIDLEIPDNSIIYCDPPYKATTKYKDDFDHEIFWEWCRLMCEFGHKVYISEYNAPNDFICIWEK